MLNTTYVYNVSGGTWTTGAAMPDGRYFPNVVYYPGNGKIYVIGGFDTSFAEASQTWEYDPVANTWNTTRASIPTAMAGSGTTNIGQYIYLAGTWGGGSGSTLHYRYDITGNAWTSVVAARLLLPGSTNFDVVRHFLEIFPPLAALAGLGFAAVARRGRAFAAVALAAVLAASVVAIHPLALTAWPPCIVQGVAGARRRQYRSTPPTSTTRSATAGAPDLLSIRRVPSRRAQRLVTVWWLSVVTLAQPIPTRSR